MAFDGTLWGRRVQATGQTPVATATGFVALFTLDNFQGTRNEIVNGGSNSALNGGGDIRVSTDNAGANQLPLEIVQFTVSATPSLQAIQFWVRFPTYEAANRAVWVFYNRAGQTQPPVTDQFGRNAVWENYIAVWHGQDVSSPIIDSSGNQIDGTVSGNVTNGSGVYLNQSFSFNRTAGAISFGNLTVPSGNRTSIMTQVSVRLNSNPTTNESIFGSRNSQAGPWCMADNSFGDTNTIVTAPDGRGTRSANGNNTAIANTPVLIHSLWANGSAGGEPLDGRESFINGQQTSSVSGATGFADPINNFEIGGAADFATVPIDGQIEEVRIYNGYKGTEHIALEYNNFSSPSTFWTMGEPEDTGGSTGVNASVSFNIPSPTFSINASNTRPTFNAEVDIDIPSPEFAVTASVTSPNFDASIALDIPSPTFSVSASNTRPEFNSAINFDVASPEFSITASNTQPGFSSTVNLTVPSPLFSIEASVTFPQFEATIGFEVPSPRFFITNLPLEADFTGTLKSSSFSGIINEVEFTGYIKTQSFSGQTKTSEFRGTIKQSIFTGVYNGNG